jgi:sec-independent protein translocase protein TatA
MFDPSAPHIIILLIVVLLLFGSRRLPGAARSLGESMHIFKKSVQGINPDEETAANPPATATAPQYATLTPTQQAVTATPDATAQQLADLQRQLSELQQQAGNGTASSGQAEQAHTTPQPF